jgi:hypothetical protein
VQSLTGFVMQFMYHLSRAIEPKNGDLPIDNHPAMFSFFPMAMLFNQEMMSSDNLLGVFDPLRRVGGGYYV